MALGRLEVEWGKNLILLTQFSVALTFLFKYAPFASWDSQKYVLKGFGPIFIAHIFVKVQEYFHGFFFTVSLFNYKSFPWIFSSIMFSLSSTMLKL